MKAGLLETRGAECQFDSPIIGVVASRNGTALAALTSDGEAVLFPLSALRSPDTWQKISLHDGGLCLASDCHQGSFLSGGEDGRVMRFSPGGAVVPLYEGRTWIDCLASTTTHFAFASKKEVTLYVAGKEADSDDILLKSLSHPSSLSGLVFDAKGKRLIASHYNGVSLWYVQARESNMRSLVWKGSHTGLAVHPQNEAVVTSMQENELHGWRLSDGHNMRMSGYPRQVRSLCFSRNGRWLATTGADAAILWPFFGGGPMGRAPMELARLPGIFSTCVCAHPKEDILAIGYQDGTILLAEISDKAGEGEDRILPVCLGSAHGGKQSDAVSALAFTPQGGALLFGTERGYVGIVDLSAPVS